VEDLVEEGLLIKEKERVNEERRLCSEQMERLKTKLANAEAEAGRVGATAAVEAGDEVRTGNSGRSDVKRQKQVFSIVIIKCISGLTVVRVENISDV
jgi:hypothetical protein